jgi:hypothetical protein
LDIVLIIIINYDDEDGDEHYKDTEYDNDDQFPQLEFVKIVKLN